MGFNTLNGTNAGRHFESSSCFLISLVFMGQTFGYEFWGWLNCVSLTFQPPWASHQSSHLYLLPVPSFLPTPLEKLFPVNITESEIVLYSCLFGTAPKWRSFIERLVWPAVNGFISAWDFIGFFKKILEVLNKSSEIQSWPRGQSTNSTTSVLQAADGLHAIR